MFVLVSTALFLLQKWLIEDGKEQVINKCVYTCTCTHLCIYMYKFLELAFDICSDGV